MIDLSEVSVGVVTQSLHNLYSRSYQPVAGGVAPLSRRVTVKMLSVKVYFCLQYSLVDPLRQVLYNYGSVCS